MAVALAVCVWGGVGVEVCGVCVGGWVSEFWTNGI